MSEQQSQLDDLIARLEKATGPDRELDCELALVAGCTEVGYRVFRGRDGKYLGAAPYYTGSIDAALTLVPEGWGWTHDGKDGFTYVHRSVNPGNDLYEFESSHDGDAIALCIAALKARAAIASATGGKG